ncbi:MAG: hypothetical protein COT85_07620 [Chlamydiae bacterium CG10_big_fil_rev_8_21_14_0_10_42_34]|nr:MAG: hypothetical protein COT85_07620 [Chlamydiae bacterium CG10_big_fil_rev_8_21_14_0_10_42_34]
MRFFLTYILLFSFCEGWEEFTYPKELITYAGMTIECTEGCGTVDDPDMEDIWSILEDTTDEIFRHVWAFDTTGDAGFPTSPVRCSDSGDYERWDWKATNGVWPSDKDFVSYREVWMNSYPTFLEVAHALREDVFFYYDTVPKKLQKFETSLVSKLEKGITQGYTIYRILPGGSVEFKDHWRGFQNHSLDAGWEWIHFRLNYLEDYGYRKVASFDREKYKQAKNRVESAIAEMDALFQNIFVYCLEHHQPEGIAFSSAVESLLAGNLEEGIDHIRQLIEIGESEQFPREILGKMHLLKGQLELESALYADAVISLTEAIVKNLDLKESYLERATAYFELGEYGSSMEDYLAYSARAESVDPFSVQAFSLAFAQNLIPGCCESGRGLYLLLSDLAQHPIHTASLMWESLTLLSKLAITNEWEQLAEAIAPEIHHLIAEWESLSSEKRGELAGYAFGKYGADLLIPVSLAKAASKGLKCGAEVSAAYKKLRAADQALLLESLSGLKSAVKIEEAVIAAQETTFLGEELALTASKMGELKQAGVLEGTIASSHELLSASMQESVAIHKKARGILRPYVKRSMPENRVRELIHGAGIPTFPRPKGIPEDYIVRITGKGAGMEYVHPTNTHLSVRVMPGKPHSPNSCQQKPYVIQKIDRGALDKAGKCISPDAPEAHIPVEEFTYRGHIDGN